MLTRKELDLWGHDAGAYRGTAQQLAEWLESTLEAELESEGIAYMPAEVRAWLKLDDA